MRNPYQRKAAVKSQNTIVSAQDLYKKFIETVVAQGYIVSLQHEGWALCSTPTGQKTLAIWQSKNLAKLLIREHWAGYQVEEVSIRTFVEKFIPFLKQNDTHIYLDMTPEGQNVLVKPDRMLIDLKQHLYDVYLKNPTQFKAMDLPAPRSIRLH